MSQTAPSETMPPSWFVHWWYSCMSQYFFQQITFIFAKFKTAMNSNCYSRLKRITIALNVKTLSTGKACSLNLQDKSATPSYIYQIISLVGGRYERCYRPRPSESSFLIQHSFTRKASCILQNDPDTGTRIKYITSDALNAASESRDTKNRYKYTQM